MSICAVLCDAFDFLKRFVAGILGSSLELKLIWKLNFPKVLDWKVLGANSTKEAENSC